MFLRQALLQVQAIRQAQRATLEALKNSTPFTTFDGVTREAYIPGVGVVVV